MYFRGCICVARNPCSSQAIERDAIHAESCYQENGEEVRRQEARKEIRPQGGREEGDAQRRGEEGLREEVVRETDYGEEVRRQEVRGEKVSRQTRAGQAQESDADGSPVRYAAGLIGLRIPTYRLIRRGRQRCGLA
jgi:hypothetical protein